MFLTCEYCGKEFHGAEVFEEALEHEKNCPVALKERLYDLIDEANQLWKERVERLDYIRELSDRAEIVSDKMHEIANKTGYKLDTDEDGYFFIKNFLKTANLDEDDDCTKCEGVCGEKNCCKDCAIVEGWSDKDKEENTLFTTKEGFTGTLKDGKLKLTPLSGDEIDEILNGIKTADLDDMVKEIVSSLRSKDSLDKVRKFWKEILE